MQSVYTAAPDDWTEIFLIQIIYSYKNIKYFFAQSAGAVEYTDCTFVEG